MRAWRSAILALAVAPLLLSCAGKTSTAPRTDIITITPDQSSTSLMPGGIVIIGITVTRPVGYTGSIALSTEGAPAGVTASLSPTTLNPDVNNSTLTLSAAPSAASGTGGVTIRATGTGIDAQAATIQVTVGAENTGTFTILASPSSMTLTKGGFGSAVISIARSGGYTGSVSLDISGFPGSIFASITPGTTSADAATLSINVSAQTPTGTYTGVISAQGQGVPSQSATISVTVLP